MWWCFKRLLIYIESSQSRIWVTPPTLMILTLLSLCIVVKSTMGNFGIVGIKPETFWNKQ